ncbi:hypothetical protein BV898_10997 [Hypsibius exemplaris]|uniref:DNA replication complex GINS protein PSF3 n=1 Tax=Hypsibius exemplaris TaxID=2072580 RepID=A0A1W0WI07_HYPEX|nr:hypothetical protein BV898_10997 [Hypsibius exemplaris]
MKNASLALTHGNYLSLSDIMVTEEKLLCTLTTDFHGLGYIQPSTRSENGDLVEGTVLDLPLWMVNPMKRNQWLEFQLPTAYQEEARRILCADPGIVEFRQGSRCRFSQNHYPLGLYIIPLADNINNSSLLATQIVKKKSLTLEEAKEVRSSLVSTFQLRFRQIMDWSNKTCHDTSAHDLKRLDRSERQLLEIGKAEQNSLISWNQRKKSKILKPSTAIKNARLMTDYADSRKRARIEV